METLKLKILQWNCNRIKPRLGWIHNLGDDIDVLCLQETWLKESDPFCIPGFNIYRKDRQSEQTDTREGGGLLIAIKKNLHFQSIQIMNPDGIEIQGIVLKGFKKTIKLYNLYHHPQKYITGENWLNLLKTLEDSQGNPGILMGDFNLHHMLWSKYSNQKGTLLANAISKTGWIVINDPNDLTRMPSPDCLPGSPDITLVSPQIIRLINWQVLPDTLGSDHFPIILTVGNLEANSKTNRTKLNTKKLDLINYKLKLEKDLIELESKTLPATDLYCSIMDKIKTGLVTHGAKISKGERKYSRKIPPWWDLECDEAVSIRKEKIEQYFNKSNRENHNEYKKADEDVKRITKSKKRAYRRKMLEEITPAKPVQQLWGMVKGLNGYINSPKSLPQNDLDDPALCKMINKLCQPPNVSIKMPIITLLIQLYTAWIEKSQKRSIFV